MIEERCQSRIEAERPRIRRRVLIVEDNVDAALTLQDLLRLSGHDVDVAYDGREALARAAALNPEIVLCDIGLPGMSGYEVARSLRALLNGTARLIAVTGYGLDADRERAMGAGFDGHLVKPITIEQLEAILGMGTGSATG